MCCALALLGLLGPRALLLFSWLIDPVRWNVAFNGQVLLPVLGFLFLPWTTLMFVLFSTVGGLDTVGWLFVALGVVLDVGTYGGGVGNRGRIQSSYPGA